MVFKKKAPIYIFKLAISTAGLVIALKISDFDIKLVYHNSQFFYLIPAFLSILLSYFFSAIRTPLIFKLAKQKLKFKASLTSYFIGNWFNQFLPTNIAGDVVRAHYLRNDLSYTKTVFTLFLDRLTGLFISVLLVTGFFFYYHDTQLIFILLVLTILVFLIFSFLAPQKTLIFKGIFTKLEDLGALDYLIITATSLFSHFFNISCYLFLFLSFNVGTNFYVLLILVPVISYISVLPISLGGWGIRETSAVLLFRNYDINEASALAISLTYGLLVFCASIPGLLLFITTKKNQASSSCRE